jgi:hypothetical protein
MSTTTGAEEGRVHYTGRALRQDAAEAMGGDIVRGLVEVITNSDDSYAREGRRGKIGVGVQHSRGTPSYLVQVRDRAAGMTTSEMHSRLAYIGERTSGFEHGLAVRGNRGRGAKDLVAFGEVKFESIKEGGLAQLILHPDGHYRVERARPASKEDRQRLHIPRGNGTQVTINVQRRFRCPRHERLAELLERDFQLRDIMADPDREVLLAKIGDSGPPRCLRYSVDWSALEELLSTEVAVPGYTGVTATVRAFKLPQRCDAAASGRTRSSGLLLKGERAIYDSTLLRFDSLPYAGWVAGWVECPAIDMLTREFDDRDERGEQHPDDNPIPLVSRRRSGLAPEHPFTKALFAAVEDVLEPVMDQLEEAERESSRQLESPQTRQELDRLGKEAAKLMQESLREIDEEDPGRRPGLPDGIAIVPEPLVVEIGSERRFSVICPRAGLEEGEEVFLRLEPEGVAVLDSGELIPLEAHRDRVDALSARGRIRGLAVEQCLLTASVDSHEHVSLVRVVEPEPEPEPLPPEGLEFERRRIKLGLGKRRAVELRAPATLVGKAGAEVSVRSSDPGIVVRDGQVVLARDEEFGWYVGKVRLEGRALGTTGTIEAVLGREVAELGVKVAERDDGVPDLRIEFSPEEPGAVRAYFDPPDPGADGGQILKILVRHPTVEQVLGREQQNERAPQWKILLAEIVAEAIVRRVVSRRYPVTREVDAQTLMRDVAAWTTKILPKMQRLLLRGVALASSRP